MKSNSENPTAQKSSKSVLQDPYYGKVTYESLTDFLIHYTTPEERLKGVNKENDK